MSKMKILLSVLIVFSQTSAIAQDKEQRTMRSFVPKSHVYDIYYPLDLQLLENDDGIVNISDSTSGMNITISSYTLKENPKDVDLIKMLNSYINESYKKQYRIEDWNSYKTKFDNLVELKANFGNSNWIWYGINNKKSIVIFSINKETNINQDEINLAMFMIDSMIIN
jgi:hypothetical protein